MLDIYRAQIESLFMKEECQFGAPMKEYTSFKIGGPAWLLYKPMSVESLERMLFFVKEHNLPFYIMGNGSNLLVSDEGYEGIVIQIARNLSDISIEGKTVTAQAGVLLSKLASEIYKARLTGFEFASGIPGTLGGAVYMNAGAYGGEMRDVLTKAVVLTRDGQLKEMTAETLELGYRHSRLMDTGDMVVSATLALAQGEPDLIKSMMLDLNNRRKEKQPLELPSAGSTFKRPTGYFAGKLIMDAGLRGYQIGGARVSDKHCGFVVNMGEATCEDVLNLIKHVQQEVKRQFGVDLEPEVRTLGNIR